MLELKTASATLLPLRALLLPPSPSPSPSPSLTPPLPPIRLHLVMNLFLIQLDPLSRVTGVSGWYWILGIKCSDTTGVGPVY